MWTKPHRTEQRNRTPLEVAEPWKNTQGCPLWKQLIAVSPTRESGINMSCSWEFDIHTSKREAAWVAQAMPVCLETLPPTLPSHLTASQRICTISNLHSPVSHVWVMSSSSSVYNLKCSVSSVDGSVRWLHLKETVAGFGDSAATKPCPVPENYFISLPTAHQDPLLSAHCPGIWPQALVSVGCVKGVGPQRAFLGQAQLESAACFPSERPAEGAAEAPALFRFFTSIPGIHLDIISSSPTWLWSICSFQKQDWNLKKNPKY